MNNLRTIFPFNKSQAEAIDFKTFCEGGSPEYISAKKKLKSLYTLHQSFAAEDDQVSNTIISRLDEEDKALTITSLNRGFKRNVTAYSIYINPLAFFDIHFALAAGAVVLVAVLEKKLAENNFIGMAAALSGILHVAFPVMAFGSAIYLISQLAVFL